MALRENILPIMENARILLADLGFRQYDVLMRVVQWVSVEPDATVGEGTKTVTDTPLTIQGRRVKARRVKQEDVVASGGKWEDIDYRIGPFTPTFNDPIAGAGGRDVSYFSPLEPADPGTRLEIYYKLTGPGIENGAWFKKVSQEVDRNWSYYFNVRKVATEDP